MKPFTLEKTFEEFMALPESDRDHALRYMNLALEASRHNVDVAYYNKRDENPTAYPFPVGD
jgi:hypothetical protein